MKLLGNMFQQTATYYLVHLHHRKHAIELATGALSRVMDEDRRAAPDEPLVQELTGPIEQWVIETLIQGAFIREYHMWERDTKNYFADQGELNGRADAIVWKSPGTHIEKVKGALQLFSARVSTEIFDLLDGVRKRVNSAKHEANLADEDYFTLADYNAAVEAIGGFWEELAGQERYTLRRTSAVAK